MGNINSSKYIRKMQIVHMNTKVGISSHLLYVRCDSRLGGFAVLAD
jgi:hypothetical protein